MQKEVHGHHTPRPLFFAKPETIKAINSPNAYGA